MIKGDRVIAKTNIEDLDWKGRGLAEAGSKGTILGKKKGLLVIKWDSGTTTWKVLPESVRSEPIIQRRFWKEYQGSALNTESTFEPGTKGDCFGNAKTWAAKHDDGNTFVVHGKITNVEGKTFDHAWIERGDSVIDATQGVEIPKEKWYKLVKAQPEAKYTPHQTMINMVRSGKLGPWFSHEVDDRFVWRKDNPKKSIKEEFTAFKQGEQEQSIGPISPKEEREVVDYILKKYVPLYATSDWPHHADRFKKTFRKVHVFPDGSIVYKINVSDEGDGYFIISRHRIGVGFSMKDTNTNRFWPWEPVIHGEKSKYGFQPRAIRSINIDESRVWKFTNTDYSPITRREEQEAMSKLVHYHPLFKYIDKRTLKKVRHTKAKIVAQKPLDEIEYRANNGAFFYKVELSKLDGGMIYRVTLEEKDADGHIEYKKSQPWDFINTPALTQGELIYENISNPYAVSPAEERQTAAFAMNRALQQNPTYNVKQMVKKIRHDKLPNGGDDIEYGGMVTGTFHGLQVGPHWQGFVIRKLHRKVQRGQGGYGALTRAGDDPNGPAKLGFAITQKPDEGRNFGEESWRWQTPYEDRMVRLGTGPNHTDELLESNAPGYHGTVGAGGIILAKDTGRILLPYRSYMMEQPHTWGVWGGKVEEGETAVQALEREIKEEAGDIIIDQLIPLADYRDPHAGFTFHNFLVIVPNEFEPKLNFEHDKAEWFKYGMWPRPAHFGLRMLLDRSRNEIQSEVKKYAKDPALIRTKKMDVIKFKAAHDLIRRTWSMMARADAIESQRDRFDYEDVSMWLLNEVNTQELLEYYGHQFYPFDNEPGYKFLEDVERVLEELELRYNRRLSRYIDPIDPLYILKKVVRGKSWEKAKFDLAKFSLSGPIVSDRFISDEEAEEIFPRLYLNAMGETFYNAGDFHRTPRLDTLQRPNNDKIVDNFLMYYLPLKHTKFPDKVKIYRGTNSPLSKVRPGDFCSFDKDYARSYIRGKYGAVVRDTLPSHDLLLYKLDPGSSEMVYWPEGHQIKKYEGQVPKFKDFFLQNR